MKKFLSLVLIFVLAFSLAGCGENKEEKLVGGPKLTIAETLKYEVKEENDMRILQIIEPSSGKVFQEIQIAAKEDIGDREYYIEDVNFDVEKDLLLPEKFEAPGVTFRAYSWNSTKGIFEEIAGFQKINNPTIDAENKLILSSRFAERVESYNKYEFSDGEFKLIATLVIEPKNEDFQLTETGPEIEGAKVLSIPADKELSLEPDRSHKKLAPYYKKGSYWDLDAEKWEDSFFTAHFIQINP